MKMLVERTPISTAAPVALAEVKEYTRIDTADFDATLNRAIKAAADEIENFGQVALLSQTIRVTVFDMVHGRGFDLPIGPVADAATASVTIDGVAVIGFDLVGGMRPHLRWPEALRYEFSARVVIEYPAGFGDAAEDIPDDLAQAVIDQAALIFYGRAPQEAKLLSRSRHLARVGARYRGVSI